MKRTIEQGGVLLAVVERADDGVVVERHFGHLEFGIDHHLEEYLKKKTKKQKNKNETNDVTCISAKIYFDVR